MAASSNISGLKFLTYNREFYWQTLPILTQYSRYVFIRFFFRKDFWNGFPNEMKASKIPQKYKRMLLTLFLATSFCRFPAWIQVADWKSPFMRQTPTDAVPTLCWKDLLSRSQNYNLVSLSKSHCLLVAYSSVILWHSEVVMIGTFSDFLFNKFAMSCFWTKCQPSKSKKKSITNGIVTITREY